MRRNLFAGSAYRMVQYAKSVYVYALSPDTKGPRREAKAHRCTRSDSRFSVAWARKQPSGTDEPRHCFVDHAYQLVFGHLGSPIRLCHVSMPSSGHLSSIIGGVRDQGEKGLSVRVLNRTYQDKEDSGTVPDHSGIQIRRLDRSASMPGLRTRRDM